MKSLIFSGSDGRKKKLFSLATTPIRPKQHIRQLFRPYRKIFDFSIFSTGFSPESYYYYAKHYIFTKSSLSLLILPQLFNAPPSPAGVLFPQPP